MLKPIKGLLLLVFSNNLLLVFLTTKLNYKKKEDKKIVGIISIGDLLKIMIKEQKELIDHLQKFITS